MTEMLVVDERDRELLQWLQDEFPVTRRPWLAGSLRLGMTEEEVLSRVRRLSADGVIRSVHTILNRHTTGSGSSTLIAMRVPEETIPSIVPVINEYRSVTHNYLREHEFNLWFTVNTGDEQELADTIGAIAERTGIDGADILDLRTRQVFKTDVRFRFSAGARTDRTPAELPAASPVPAPFDETDRALLTITQHRIPLSEEPFTDIADRLHIDQAGVLGRLERRIRDGTIKRIGGSFSQRKLGIIANAVVAWKVPAGRVEETGRKLSSYDEVTHCYERSTVPGVFEYDMFTVLHGYDREWVESYVQRLSETIGVSEYRIIFSRTQFKRTSMIHDLQDVPENNAVRCESNTIPVRG